MSAGALATRAPDGVIPDPVAATLRRLTPQSPAEVARAQTALSRTLEPIARSPWPEIAQRFSRLTNTGMPIEFAWTSRDAALRWTAEVAGPEHGEAGRLGLAARAAFSSPGPARDLCRRIVDLQAGERLRFGAWIGVRHRAESDESKVYAEMPAMSLAGAATALGMSPDLRRSHPALRSAGLTVRMAGVSADGSVELYARGFDIDAALLRGLETSVFGRDDRLWPGVRDVSASDRLPRPSGVSITVLPDGVPAALTWFTFAKALFGSDAATAKALDSRTTHAASRSLLGALVAGEDDGRWRFGMLGVGVAGAGERWLQASIRPT